MTVGEQIKRLRIERGMSQEQLAEAVDVTRQSVSKWETGRANPDMDKLILLSQIYGISIAELTGTKSAETTQTNSDAGMRMELRRMRHKRNVWRVIALVCIFLMLAGSGAALYVIGNYYPQFWQKIGLYNALNEDRKTVELTHNNLYEDGIDGILSDLGEVIDFPEYLMLTRDFDLRFAPDGTITSIDTMWYGYDERYTYVDSYLITYDADKSNKVSVYFNGGTGSAYDKDKDLNVLFDAMRLIPFEDAVANWKEPEYGVLYKGVRDWGYNTEGIVYLDRKGNLDIPSNEVYSQIVGPTVSVYCTGDDSITPVRYLFNDDNTRRVNVN